MSKVMIVIGGSRGIGAATAILAAERGYGVCINYRSNKAAAEGVVSSITKTGGQAIALQADVAVEAAVVRLFREVDERMGPVTALVNNAGILETQMRLDEMDAARLSRVFTARSRPGQCSVSL